MLFILDDLQVGLEATMTGEFSGDVAVDNIGMTSGRCER